jgi:hypothetical protein
LLLAATATLLPAQDDRDRTTPASAIWASGQSTTDVQNLIDQGWRVTDLEIESTSPFTFTVAMVQNTGSWAKAWWWAVGVTSTQLSSSLSQNNARLIDIEPYDDNGTTRFCAVMIGNTGADQKTWWWGFGMTSGQVNSSVTTNNARLTCLRRYTVGGATSYAVVMISNTGPDQRVWGYLYGASSATINQNIAQNGNRIYGIERVAADSYDVILVQNAGFGHWYYFDVAASVVTELLEQNIGRLIDIERHATPLGARYNVAMLDNANALERAARQDFLGAVPTGLGDYGFYLKEANGPILAQMRPNFAFEPASTMKTLYHVHAMGRVRDGAVALSSMINKPDYCGIPGSDQTLELTLREMMEYSDNMSTLAVSNRFGIDNIQATAAALGMASTQINFTLGCQSPVPTPNELTLRDLGHLHEQVVNGWLGRQRATFYELMAESQASFPSGGSTSLDARINAEAAALGLPAAVRDAFKSALHIAYKPGGAGISGTFWYAEGGWMSVPFKDAAGTLLPREYVFGVFNHSFTSEASGAGAMFSAELTLVWDRVRAALQTWDNHVSGSFTPLGSGCPGSAGTPVHGGSGTPEVDSFFYLDLANAPANAPTFLSLGWSSTSWNGVPLPVPLPGAPGCLLRIDLWVTLSGVASSNGSRSQRITVPNLAALIGANLYSQYFVFDPPANALQLTTSGALRTTIGGWL